MNTVTIIVIIFCVIIGAGWKYVTNQPDDNPVEESMEAIIERELSMPSDTIDLSPGTPENK